MRWLAAVVCTWAFAASAGEPALYVFLPVGAKPAALEKQLRSSLPGVTVTVFGRINDLRSQLEREPPTAVLSHREVLVSLALTPDYQGEREGSASAAWLLVSTHELTSPSALRGKTVGLIDLLGRKQLPAFAGALLGVANVSVQSVTKVDDLLPLLQFNTVDAVLVPEASFAELRARTQMDLFVLRPELARVGHAAVARVGAADRAEFEKTIGPHLAQLAALAGVESWSKR